MQCPQGHHADYVFFTCVQLPGPPPFGSKPPQIPSTVCHAADLQNLVLDGTLVPSYTKEDVALGKHSGNCILLAGKDDQETKKDFKEKNKVAGFSPVKQYRDGKGRRRFHGTSALTQTQNLGSMIQIADESGSTMFFNMFNICIHCI
jgi:hypothetical protein